MMMLRSSLWKNRQSPGWVSQTTGSPSRLVIWTSGSLQCWWSNGDNEIPKLTKAIFVGHNLPIRYRCWNSSVQPGPLWWQEHQPSRRSCHEPAHRNDNSAVATKSSVDDRWQMFMTIAMMLVMTIVTMTLRTIEMMLLMTIAKILWMTFVIRIVMMMATMTPVFPKDEIQAQLVELHFLWMLLESDWFVGRFWCHKYFLLEYECVIGSRPPVARVNRKAYGPTCWCWQPILIEVAVILARMLTDKNLYWF